MTERKTTEIKIRVTPSEKARWQGDAEREGVSLSELICRNMNVTQNFPISISPVAPHFPTVWANPAQQCSPEARSWCSYPECKGGACKPHKGYEHIISTNNDPKPAWTPETHPASLGTPVEEDSPCGEYTHPAKSWMYEGKGG